MDKTVICVEDRWPEHEEVLEYLATFVGKDGVEYSRVFEAATYLEAQRTCHMMGWHLFGVVVLKLPFLLPRAFGINKLVQEVAVRRYLRRLRKLKEERRREFPDNVA